MPNNTPEEQPKQTPEQEVDMLIHDCMQYAIQASQRFKAGDHAGLASLNWKPTTDPRRWIIRLRHLKDALIRLNGEEPFPWNKDDPPDFGS